VNAAAAVPEPHPLDVVYRRSQIRVCLLIVVPLDLVLAWYAFFDPGRGGGAHALPLSAAVILAALPLIHHTVYGRAVGFPFRHQPTGATWTYVPGLFNPHVRDPFGRDTVPLGQYLARHRIPLAFADWLGPYRRWTCTILGLGLGVPGLIVLITSLTGQGSTW